MSRAWVLLTALPPTRGHLALIRFAASVARSAERDAVNVLVCTQPGEPFVVERPAAVAAAIELDPVLRERVRVLHYAETVQQVPSGDDDTAFWTMWAEILHDHGFRVGDLVVASEPYGIELASAAGGRFIPYDLDRVVVDCDATRVRDDPIGQFSLMLPTFSRLLTRRITFFGAESTGKTTLSTAVAASLDAHLLPEWARPYLDLVGTEVTDAAMHDIWVGQRALQESVRGLDLRPFIVQDTDLFSTLGYWEIFDPARVPAGLVDDALATSSDLYVMCPSDIPFEADPQRFGGDRRETSDQYWIDLLERFSLPYVVLSPGDRRERLDQARALVLEQFDPSVLAHERIR